MEDYDTIVETVAVLPDDFLKNLYFQNFFHNFYGFNTDFFVRYGFVRIFPAPERRKQLWSGINRFRNVKKRLRNVKNGSGTMKTAPNEKIRVEIRISSKSVQKSLFFPPTLKIRIYTDKSVHLAALLMRQA